MPDTAPPETPPPADLPPVEALRQAQLNLKKQYPDPYYWGAFICQGDPSPLPALPAGVSPAGPP